MFPACLSRLSSTYRGRFLLSGKDKNPVFSCGFSRPPDVFTECVIEPNSSLFTIWILTCPLVSLPPEHTVTPWGSWVSGCVRGIQQQWMDGRANRQYAACLCVPCACMVVKVCSIAWHDTHTQSILGNYMCSYLFLFRGFVLLSFVVFSTDY